MRYSTLFDNLAEGYFFEVTVCIVEVRISNKTIERFMLVYDLFDYKKMPFEVLQNAVREKPAKLEELALLNVCLWLVLE